MGRIVFREATPTEGGGVVDRVTDETTSSDGLMGKTQRPMIPIIAGVKTYGRITTSNGATYATQFAHLFFIPLIPLRGVYGRMHPLSVLATYLRVWGFFALGLLIFTSGSALGLRRDWAEFFVGALLTFGVWAFAMLKLGRPQPSKRTIALVLGVPVIAMAVSLGIGFKERKRWEPIDEEIRRQYQQ